MHAQQALIDTVPALANSVRAAAGRYAKWRKYDKIWSVLNFLKALSCLIVKATARTSASFW